MSEQERDPYTGRLTTGHEWNGIKELTTPIPMGIWVFLISTIVVSVILWILYPTWPLGNSYTRGLLDTDQKMTVEQSLRLSRDTRMQVEEQILAASFDSLTSDPALVALTASHGSRLFNDNCAACHGMDAAGQPGFPSLVDDQWLWGGSPEEIMETLRVGINSTHVDTRISEMMAFGRLGMLDATARENVAAYVMSLSRPDQRSALGASVDLDNGKAIYDLQCASCHADDGRGMTSVGAPNLTDEHWIYGGTKPEILETIDHGRKGVMPFWSTRLSEADRKLVTAYLLSQRETAP